MKTKDGRKMSRKELVAGIHRLVKEARARGEKTILITADAVRDVVAEVEAEEALSPADHETKVDFLRPVERRVYDAVVFEAQSDRWEDRTPNGISVEADLPRERSDKHIETLVSKGLVKTVPYISPGGASVIAVVPVPVSAPEPRPEVLLPATRPQIRDYVEDAFDEFTSTTVYGPESSRRTRVALVRQIQTMPMVRRSVVKMVTDIAVRRLAAVGLEAPVKVISDRVARVLRPEYRFLEN